MQNERIRNAAKEKNVYLWEVAKRFGVNDVTFSKWLREEFTESATEAALRFIDDIAASRQQVR